MSDWPTVINDWNSIKMRQTLGRSGPRIKPNSPKATENTNIKMKGEVSKAGD